jgi:uncharacterized protein YjdB
MGVSIHKRALSIVICIAMLIGSINITAFGASMSQTDSGDSGMQYFAELRQKFYDLAVGGNYDPADPKLQPILQSINGAAQQYWNSMNQNPVSNAVGGRYRDSNDQLIPGLDYSQDYIWADYPLGKRNPDSSDYINANSLQFTFQYLRAMALAYNTKGCNLYHNEAMLQDIKKSIKFVYDNHFNTSINRYGNWFSWQIGGPIYFAETLLLLYNEFTPEEMHDYATAMIYFLGTTTMTGANATWTERVRLYAGILLNDSSWLDFVKGRMPEILQYSTGGDGYYPDGTFIQHTYYAYNGGYGLDCLMDSSFIIFMLTDTPWAVDQQYVDLVYKWVKENYEPVVYKGLVMDAFRGREITRPDMTQPRGGLDVASAMLLLAKTAPDDIASSFKSIIKGWFSNDYMIQQMNNSADNPWYKAPLDTANQIYNILDDDGIQPENLENQNFQMGVGARTVQFGKNYAYAISMSSKRIKTYEDVDGDIKGWNTGNGMTYLYNDDMERLNGLFKCTVDWNRLPGATAVYNGKQGICANLNSFVGGVSQNGFGVTGMDMSMAANQLKAKKSWFMFDDKIVALGSNISGKGQVETTLENYMLGANNRSYSVNGKSYSTQLNGSAVDYSNVSTFHMQGNVPNSDIGFYFLKPTDIKTMGETRTAKWSDLGAYNTDTTTRQADYLTIWQSHGASPSNGSYAYVLLPNKTNAETQAFAESSDVQVLQQDDTIHAVYDKDLDVLGANFWKDGVHSLDAKGVKNYISSDAAASVMVQENDHYIDVSVSDPTQENNGYVTVEINRAAKGVLQADEGVEVLQSSPSIKLKVNVKDSVGKTFHARLSFADVELQPTEILSTTMNEDALTVALKKSPNATSYDISYGTAPGSYSGHLQSRSTTANIYGLTPGQTYYLTAAAVDSTDHSSPSPEVSFTVPATTSFADDFTDFSKMQQYSGGWQVDTATPEKFSGDTSRLKRAAQTKESFTYMLPSLQDFSLDTYGYNKSLGVINLYTSSDGETWIPQAYKATGADPTGTEWFKKVLVPDGAINAGANYLKVELVSHPTKAWAPEFSRFTAVMGNNCDEKTLKDPMQNDSKIYETKNISFTPNTDSTKFGGDADVASATDDDNELLYSWTNIQSADITAYQKSGGTVEVLASSDGDNFTAVDTVPSDGATDSNGYVKTVFSAHSLPAGTNYIKLVLHGDITLSSMSLDYKPSNTPIQKIRFADSKLDGVVKYDATPLLKVAPANADSQLDYSTLNEDVAKYNNGVLTFYTSGETKAIVTIDGTQTSAELPLRVYSNVALKRPVTVSSVNSTYPASNAVDGNMSVSRWQSSGSTSSEWLQVDLGTGASFDSLDIQWYSNGPNYDICLSDNGTDWTTIKSVTGADTGKYVRFDFDTPQKGRFLKIVGISPSQYSLFEIRALSKTSVDVQDWNLALGGVPSVSSSDPNDASLVPANAIDGMETSRWASGRTDNEWYVVDLGQTSSVDAINILWESYGKEYKVQISDNGSTWTDMVHETSGASGWKNYSLPQVYNGRYVRMLGIKRGTTYGYSMYEFQVMGTNSSKTTPYAITKIQYPSNTVNVLNGQSTPLSIVTDPATVNEISVGWESSDPDVISVNNSGVVTAHQDHGSAVITAYSTVDPSVKATCTVAITPYAGIPVPVTGIAITAKPDHEMNVNETFNLAAVVSPEQATNSNIRWTSSDPSVALVNCNGKITALHSGDATITATSVASGMTDDIAVSVAEPVTYTVTYDPGEHGTLNGDGSETVIAGSCPSNVPTVTPDAGYVFAGWSCDGGTTLLTVDQLWNVQIEAGLTYTAYYTSQSNAVLVTGVTLDRSTLSLTTGSRSQTLNATITPANATDKNVTWSTSNSGVATVNKGVVTPVSVGTAIITVTTEDGGKSASCTVTVTSSTSHSSSTNSTPSLPSSVTDTTSKSIVDLSGATFPAGVTKVTLSVTQPTQNAVPDPQEADALRIAASDAKQLGTIDTPFVYNLKLLDQYGNAITSFNGNVTVRIPVPAGLHGVPHVFRYEESTGTFTDMSAVVENGFLVFSTNHFSYYLVSGVGDSITLDTKTYAMSADGRYQIGVKLTGTKATSVKVYSTNDKTATATKLANGNYQVTGKGAGTAYIMFDVYDNKNKLLTHASVRVDIKTGIRPKGDSTRQIGTF